MSEKVITVKHEIIKPKQEPKLEPLKPLDEEEKKDAESLHQLWFDDFKLDLAKAKPELRDKILACEDGYQLEGILQEEKDKKADNIQPTKPPKGKARLIEQPDYTNSLTQAENEAQLINRLYAQAKTRDREQTKQKQIAKDKIDKMYKSMVENPKLGARVKDIPNAVRDFNPCPRCGAVVEANFNIKGATCSVCGFVSGQGSYVRKVY